MAFTSVHFLVFFPVVLTLYFVLPYRLRWGMLLVASFYFYMAWRPEYIVLLLGAITVSYVGARGIAGTDHPGRKRAWLASAIGVVLAVLFVYKYYDFFNATLTRGLARVGVSVSLPVLDLVLPIGISFYSFQLVSYLIDVFRGRLPAERHFGRFALYTSFFPQLVAGPIERAVNLLPQLSRKHDFDYARVTSGLRLMAWGFFKKLVVADRLAPFVQTVYAHPQGFPGISLMLATFFFAFQVYCDFSAYSDIAIGAARTMGIDLMQNFRQPYFATSIADFWKRWHISLSTWLTDYVYSSFTRARWLKLKWYPKFLVSLFLTFLVSGVWHGANWTFIAWGALHGGYLVSSMLTQRFRRQSVSLFRLDRLPRVHRAMQVAITFGLVCISYIFFRAENLRDAWYILTHLLDGTHGLVMNLTTPGYVARRLLFVDREVELILAFAGIAVVVAMDVRQQMGSVGAWIAARPGWLRWSCYYALVCVIVVLGSFYDRSPQFIYFQF